MNLRKHGIKIIEELVLESSDTNLMEKIRFCLTNHEVDGTFTYSDYLAFEIYKLAAELKITILEIALEIKNLETKLVIRESCKRLEG